MDGNTGAKRERSFRVFYGDDKSRRICKESNIYRSAQMATFIPSFEIKDISKEFNTQEEANKYLESLVDEPGAVQYANKKVEKKTEQLDTQKPENELIKSIEGIEWLRKAGMIDLENNAISDLSPLSINYLESLGSAEGLTDIDEGKKWFGEQLRNTHLNISLNPVRKYPVIAGGRLIIKQTLDQAFKLGADPVILINRKIIQMKI